MATNFAEIINTIVHTLHTTTTATTTTTTTAVREEEEDKNETWDMSRVLSTCRRTFAVK